VCLFGPAMKGAVSRNVHRFDARGVPNPRSIL
jgi:hypothetical protein